MTNEKQSDEKESAADIGSVVDVFAICCGEKKRRRCGRVEAPVVSSTFVWQGIRCMTQVSITSSKEHRKLISTNSTKIS